MPTPTDLLDLLPGELRYIGERIGVEGALRLVEKWPGVRIYIPKAVGPDHPLAELLGLEDARTLCETYPGEGLDLPVALKWRLAMRNALIAQSGQSQRALALGHRLTVRQIRNIQSAAKADSGQESLF
ncbi:MAG: hypothetical protein Q8O79_00935 [Pseudomonadota bacterium]|nr:hypothetical protein [Pseudomonadota bacterium]